MLKSPFPLCVFGLVVSCAAAPGEFHGVKLIARQRGEYEVVYELINNANEPIWYRAFGSIPSLKFEYPSNPEMWSTYECWGTAEYVELSPGETVEYVEGIHPYLVYLDLDGVNLAWRTSLLIRTDENLEHWIHCSSILEEDG